MPTSIIPFTLLNLVMFVSGRDFYELLCWAMHVQRCSVADLFNSFVALMQNSTQDSLKKHSALLCGYFDVYKNTDVFSYWALLARSDVYQLLPLGVSSFSNIPWF